MDVTDCLLFHLAKTYQRVHQQCREDLKSYGLTPIQSLIMSFVSEKVHGISASEISRELNLDSATLSGILERLESAGWVRRTISEEDKRLSIISLTDKYHQVRQEIEAVRASIEEAMFANFSTEEKLLFIRMLKDMRLS